MKNADFYNGNIAFIKTDNVRHGYIDRNFNDYLSELGNEQISRTTLQPNDIITTIIGATEKVVARSAIIQKDLLPCNINQNIVQIRVNDAIISPYYVYFYLNSFYGKNYLYYYSRQTEQINLNCNEVSYVRIPRFSNKFQSLLDDIFVKSQLSVQNAEKGYKSAEELLNIELHINGIQNSKNYSIKSYLNSFCKTKRLDAEYYQDKYDYILKKIQSYKNGCNTVETYFNYVKTKCTRSHSSYLYIEIGDVNIGNGDAYPNLIPTEKLPDNAQILTKKGDILVSTVRPNRGAIVVVDSEGILVSGAFTVLRNKNCGYLSETLQVLFRTEVYRNWLLKYNVGTSYPVIKDKDVLNMKVPIFSKDIQMDIFHKVRKSCHLRKLSKDLIDKSIKAVEIAIEKNEEYAFQWLIENTNEIYHKAKY